MTPFPNMLASPPAWSSQTARGSWGFRLRTYRAKARIAAGYSYLFQIDPTEGHTYRDYEMPPPLHALAATGVAALTGVVMAAGASSASGTAAAPCTLLAAKSGILASKLPMRVKHDAAGRGGSGIDRLICRDLTYDGRTDMVASVYSGGAAGVEAWVFFRAVTSGWKLSFHRTGLVRAAIRVSTTSVFESDPVYRVGDKRPCCPTGGRKHYRFQWQRGKMVKVRAWRTRPA